MLAIGFLSAPFVLPANQAMTLREFLAGDRDLDHLAVMFYLRRFRTDELVVHATERPLVAHRLRLSQSATTREVYDLLRRNGLRPGNFLTALSVGVHYPDIFYRHHMVVLGERPRRLLNGDQLHSAFGYNCDSVRGCRDCYGDRNYMCIECLYSGRTIRPGSLWVPADDFLVVRRDPR